MTNIILSGVSTVSGFGTERSSGLNTGLSENRPWNFEIKIINIARMRIGVTRIPDIKVYNHLLSVLFKYPISQFLGFDP